MIMKMGKRDNKANQTNEFLVEYVKQFYYDNTNALLNLTDSIARPVLQTLVLIEHKAKLALLKETIKDQKVYQNGLYTRKVKWGDKSFPIKISRLRYKNQSSKIVVKYQRSFDTKFIFDIISLASNDLSDNEISNQLTNLYGFQLSEELFLEYLKQLRPDTKKWHSKSLHNNYKTLLFDLKPFKIKINEDQNVKFKNKVLYLVVAINHQNKSELISFYVNNKETEQNWSHVLEKLKKRGLSEPELVVYKKSQLLKEPLDKIYPKAKQIVCADQIINDL
ncbi:transposase [Mycoplasmoides gallisepticum]|uniref:transposase n=1 Tax=Mycoplasmoides gallisepticum TaxID=2096 RepID=UPI003364D67E